MVIPKCLKSNDSGSESKDPLPKNTHTQNGWSCGWVDSNLSMLQMMRASTAARLVRFTACQELENNKPARCQPQSKRASGLFEGTRVFLRWLSRNPTERHNRKEPRNPSMVSGRKTSMCWGPLLQSHINSPAVDYEYVQD